MVDQDHQLQKKEEYAMSKDNVLALRNPGIASEVSDILTQVLRDEAQHLVARAIETEVAEFLERYRFDVDQAGAGAHGTQWILTGADDPDGARRGWHQSATGAGSRRQDSLHFLDSAAVFTAHQNH
jgi:hypothetical protein